MHVITIKHSCIALILSQTILARKLMKRTESKVVVGKGACHRLSYV